jgi:hypothetical protein
MAYHSLCFFLVLFFAVNEATAQWAVYDEEVKQQLVRVNKIDVLQGFDRQNSTYDHYEAAREESGDVKLGTAENGVTLKSLDTKFEDSTKLPDLTQEQIAKYVGTEADCGQKQVSAKHWEACTGLRNLRLQTMFQSHALLKNLFKRREQIVKLNHTARKLPTGEKFGSLGQLQRATFEVQGQQALMQADALQIQVLMDGYRQREALYMTQQAEARKSMLAQAQAEKNPRPPRFLPLIRPKPGN